MYTGGGRGLPAGARPIIPMNNTYGSLNSNPPPPNNNNTNSNAGNRKGTSVIPFNPNNNNSNSYSTSPGLPPRGRGTPMSPPLPNRDDTSKIDILILLMDKNDMIWIT